MWQFSEGHLLFKYSSNTPEFTINLNAISYDIADTTICSIPIKLSIYDRESTELV